MRRSDWKLLFGNERGERDRRTAPLRRHDGPGDPVELLAAVSAHVDRDVHDEETSLAVELGGVQRTGVGNGLKSRERTRHQLEIRILRLELGKPSLVKASFEGVS